MGHTEIARLPTSQRWKVVMGLLHSPHLEVPAAASAVTLAARSRLEKLGDDPSIAYCFWLLTRVASAARGTNFLAELDALGVQAQPSDSVLQFLARVADQTREHLMSFPESGPFGEMAATALRQSLAETVGLQGRSLFGSSLEDLESAFRRYSTPIQFGDLAQRFFASFMSQTLRFYVDRELPHVIGSSELSRTSDAADFTRALDRHSRELARVVERFAIGWYSKKNWERLGAISHDDAKGFVGHALPKLRGAVIREGKR